jgi:elongator complex protein 2
LFENLNDNAGFVPVAADKSHTRIIWDCAWAQEGDVFATASRDKTVKIWRRADREEGKKWIPAASIKFHEAATAVAFAPYHADGRRRLAVGLETGDIHVYSSTPTKPSNWNLDVSLNSRTAHVNHVYRLAWRPTSTTSTKELATCSEDGTLKILIVHVGFD